MTTGYFSSKQNYYSFLLLPFILCCSLFGKAQVKSELNVSLIGQVEGKTNIDLDAPTVSLVIAGKAINIEKKPIKNATDNTFLNEEFLKANTIKEFAFMSTGYLPFLKPFLSCLVFYLFFIYLVSDLRANNQVYSLYNDNLVGKTIASTIIEKELPKQVNKKKQLVTRRARQLERQNIELNKVLKDLSKKNAQLEDIITVRNQKIKELNNKLKSSNKDSKQFGPINSKDIQARL